MQKVVALFSGGLDSTVLIYYLRNLDRAEVLPISIFYGQKHKRELRAVQAVCDVGGFPGQLVPLEALQYVLHGSSQIDSSIEVPEGHYADDNMRVTVVPNRNMILLSIATAYSISQKADTVAYAAHAGDHAQYPDCRESFIAAMSRSIQLCDYNPPDLWAPFASRSKADIVMLGAELSVPMHLTWSCYKGGAVHCGRCGTCCERAEAFYLARVPDPTVYEDREFWKTVTKETL